jgi:hypothetical protein
MRKVAFEPCITRGTKVPTGTDWIHEIKHDGYTGWFEWNRNHSARHSRVVIDDGQDAEGRPSDKELSAIDLARLTTIPRPGASQR